MPLGKGLGALIGPSSRKTTVLQTGSGAAGLDKLWLVPLSEITANPNQPRKNFAPAELEELAASIKEHGILQPLLVSEKSDGGYELIAGERRLRAARRAGLTSVPVIVKKYSDETKLSISLIENIQRADLNPIEEAFAYKRLIEEFGLTQEAVASKVGKSRPSVANMIRLLELPNEVQQALIDGKISTGQARAVLSIGDKKAQLDILASMLGSKITVRELERTATAQNPSRARGRDPNLNYLEEKLRAALGTKVTISQKGERGAVVIDYFSKEELARIIKKIAP
ncbi:MAG: ParB/RepB/Spo0J family partition protein [Candidatus Magasanikbacteria bacterium]|nr:ParB/RepB/Spo0J family partition protein [Candidatus Magasanikbacteria bacterium]